MSYVPEEEIGGPDGAAKFVESKEFEDLNVGFVLDEGQASPGDEFRVFYADRTPWNVIIKSKGAPGHGSRLYDNGAMENLMKSIEVVSRFRERVSSMWLRLEKPPFRKLFLLILFMSKLEFLPQL